MKAFAIYLPAVIGAAAIGWMSAAPDSKPLAEQPPPAAIQIAAWYSFTGHNPDGTDYAGVSVIERRGDKYLVRWFMEEGLAQGIGQLDGDSLWVGFRDGPNVGLVRYKVTLEKDKPKLANDQETMVWLKGLK